MSFAQTPATRARLTHPNPSVIVIDDLDLLGDNSSWVSRFLLPVARECGARSRHSLIVTHGGTIDEELEHAIDECFDVHELRPITSNDVQILWPERLSDRVARNIVALTGGRPGTVVSTIRGLRKAEAIGNIDGQIDFEPEHANYAELCTTELRTDLRHHETTLGTTEPLLLEKILTAAAVVGDTFPDTVVAKALGADVNMVSDLLDEFESTDDHACTTLRIHKSDTSPFDGHQRWLYRFCVGKRDEAALLPSLYDIKPSPGLIADLLLSEYKGEPQRVAGLAARLFDLAGESRKRQQATSLLNHVVNPRVRQLRFDSIVATPKQFRSTYDYWVALELLTHAESINGIDHLIEQSRQLVDFCSVWSPGEPFLHARARHASALALRGDSQDLRDIIKIVEDVMDSPDAAVASTVTALWAHAFILKSLDARAAFQTYKDIVEIASAANSEHNTIAQCYAEMAAISLGAGDRAMALKAITEFEALADADNPAWLKIYYVKSILNEEQGDIASAYRDVAQAARLALRFHDHAEVIAHVVEATELAFKHNVQYEIRDEIVDALALAYDSSQLIGDQRASATLAAFRRRLG